MTLYHARSYVPPRVQRAQALVQQFSFTKSSLPEVGRLLATLAAAIPQGRIGEIGTGCGVGTAWMASALGPQASIVTVDINGDYINAVRQIFADDPRIQALHGDWREIAAHAPFQLLFADGGHVKSEHPEAMIDLLAPGGMLVLDDLTPEEHWPEEWQGWEDPTRTFWLNSARVVATEIRVTECHAVILATRAQE